MTIKEADVALSNHECIVKLEGKFFWKSLTKKKNKKIKCLEIQPKCVELSI